MGAFEEFQGMVSAGLSALDEGFELIQLARDKYAEARAELAGVLASGSSSEKVEASLARLDQVVTALDAAMLWRDKGIEEFDEYLEQIGAQGSSGTRGSVGDQVTAPKLQRGDLEKEHAGSDDGDSEMSRKRRISRGLIRNGEAIDKQTQSWTKSSIPDRLNIDPPPPGELYSGTGQASAPDPGPSHGKVSEVDLVGAIALISAAGFNLAASYRRKKKEQKSG